jgi:hypothetical protein
MRRFLPTIAAIIGSVILLTASGAGQAPAPKDAPPDVPDAIQVPAGEEVVLYTHATGSQIYTCQAGADGKFNWTLKAPDAELHDRKDKVIGPCVMLYSYPPSGRRSARLTKERCGRLVPTNLAATAIKGALDRVPQLDPKEIEDVILGCAMPEAEQGMNVARIASLRAGLPVEVSAMTINRFCSSGLQAIAMAAERIMAGGAETIVAGGVESMTMIPMGGNKVSANPWLVSNYPDAYLSMGLTAERVAKRFNITRQMQDEFSVAATRKRSRRSQQASSTTNSFPCRSASPLRTAASPSALTSSSRWTKARAPTLRSKRCSR